jgi:hypothetical protein
MTIKKMEYVWYAGYGSNLSWARFRCYLFGGRPPFAQAGCRAAAGCRKAASPPVESRMIEIPHQLYFALPEATPGTDTWGPGGVAFIRTDRDREASTVCRIWMITQEQYVAVKAQEGRLYAEDVMLGSEDSYPIRTVTHPVPFKNLRAPSWSYLKTIAVGLRETYRLKKRRISDTEIAAYLAEKPGIKGELDRSRVERWVAAETAPD